MMDMMAKEQTDYDELEFDMVCTSCQDRATFVYRGKQTFPQAVADQLGLPAVIHLWSCGSCHSTISHVDLGIEL